MVQLMKRRRIEETPPAVMPSERAEGRESVPMDSVAVGPGDPLETVLLAAGGPVEVSSIELQSETLDRLRDANVELIVPLIGQGELLGALYLGPRLSDQPYSSEDRRLLGNLASQVAPAIKVAQLVREQQAEAKERERIQQELQVAALIQHTLLPKELPAIRGWGVDAFYRPAQAVGGDFYDFIDLDDGRLGVVIGDVTDKGVPAALVMATCRSMLRAVAPNHDSPSAVLQEVNEKLVPEIPPAMFVTCLYAIFDTRSAVVTFANAGHNLPYVHSSDGVLELRATGMPLGLMEGMTYEERSYSLSEGDVIVLTSDGITEAHNSDGEMYGFSRLMARVERRPDDGDMVGAVLGDLEEWTGGNEQEDDITLVVISRGQSAETSASVFPDPVAERQLAAFTVPSVEGNERLAIEKVAAVTGGLGIKSRLMERVKTAVGECVMNAIEHGNLNDPSLEVGIEVATRGERLLIRVTDHGGDREMPEGLVPDIEAKVAGEQTPRGWGLFLISQMVDEVNMTDHDGKRTVELVIDVKGES